MHFDRKISKEEQDSKLRYIWLLEVQIFLMKKSLSYILIIALTMQPKWNTSKLWNIDIYFLQKDWKYVFFIQDAKNTGDPENKEIFIF